MMKRLTGYLVLAALAFGALVPASALAVKEVVVPPGNAGVNQYTQTVPTAGGNAVVKHHAAKSPKKVLGKGAEELEAEGPEGKAAAELAAQGAAPVAGATEEAAPEPKPKPKHKKKAAGKGHGKGKKHESGAAAGNSQGGGNGGGKPAQNGEATTTGEAVAPQSDGGSSGLGKIVDQVTGSGSSGELGLWMPLVLLAGLAWFVVYTWRRRGHSS
jgi:hypothetical protein